MIRRADSPTPFFSSPPTPLPLPPRRRFMIDFTQRARDAARAPLALF